MGDNYSDLEPLCIGAKRGNIDDMYKLIQIFDRDLRKRSYVCGRFNEDAFQEMCIKLLKCIKNFKYKRAS